MPRSTDQKRSRPRRLIAVVVACALLAAIVAKPSPARADTEEAFIYAGIGLGIYITIIVVATLIIYRYETPDSSSIPLASLQREDYPSSPIQPGTHCVQRDGLVTLLCW